MKLYLNINETIKVVLPVLLILALCSITLIAENKTSPLLLEWRFNEGRGAIFTESKGKGILGVLSGGYKWVTGITGKKDDFALQFNGKNGYGMIKCLTEDGKKLTLKKGTVEIWIKIQSFPANQQYFTILSDDRYFGFNVNKNPKSQKNRITLFWKNIGDNSFYSLPSKILSDKEIKDWCHVACVYDGKNVKLYINGKESMYKSYYTQINQKNNSHLIEQEIGVPYTGAITINNLEIGNNILGNHLKRQWFPGAVDNLGITSKPKTPKELGYFTDKNRTISQPNIIPVIDL